MKKIYLNIIFICCVSLTNAQSKKEIIQELTSENSNLKNEITALNYKINSLEAENLNLKNELAIGKVEMPQDYGKTLFDLFISQRLNNYPELQFQLSDTIYLTKKSFKEKFNDIKNNALKFYLEGANKGIDWSKAKFQKVDFEVRESDRDVKTISLRGKVFFVIAGKEYSFRNGVSILENGKWRGYYFDHLVDITEEKENEIKAKQERLNQPYVPYNLIIGDHYTYSAYPDDPKHLSGLKISIRNDTNYNINWLKFQLKIIDNDGNIILSKNIIVSDVYGLDSELEPGEKEMAEIKEITDLYIGSGVMNKKWSIETELLEAKPKQFED